VHIARERGGREREGGGEVGEWKIMCVLMAESVKMR
jgi:hypothetical protein